MQYFLSYDGKNLGPYSYTDVLAWWKHGRIPANALISQSGSQQWRPITDVMPAVGPAGRRTTQAPQEGQGFGTISSTQVPPGDWMWPFKTFFSFEWVNQGGVVGMLAIGLMPLGLAMCGPRSPNSIIWEISIYFSLLWALFFYHFFKTSEVLVRYCTLAFFFTPFCSALILLASQHSEYLTGFFGQTESKDFQTKFWGYIFAVGYPEELAKAAIVLILVSRAAQPLRPSTIILYGIMSGLGFSFIEQYLYLQRTGERLSEFSSHSSNALDIKEAVTYSIYTDIIRVSTCPFIHAMWAGISAYYIGACRLMNAHKWISCVIGLTIAATLHGFYDAFQDTDNDTSLPMVSLGAAAFSVFILLFFAYNSRKLEARMLAH